MLVSNVTTVTTTKTQKKRNNLKIFCFLTCVIVVACTTKLNKILACFWYLKNMTKTSQIFYTYRHVPAQNGQFQRLYLPNLWKVTGNSDGAGSSKITLNWGFRLERDFKPKNLLFGDMDILWFGFILGTIIVWVFSFLLVYSTIRYDYCCLQSLDL